MEGKYPIIIDGAPLGALEVKKNGARTQFRARCRMVEGLLRLSVYGDGKEGYLGVMAPESGELTLTRSLSPLDMRAFPSVIEYAGRAAQGQAAPVFAPKPPTDTSPAPQPPMDTSPAPQPPTDTSPAPQPPTDTSPAPQPPTDTSPAPQPPTDTSPAPQPPTDTSPAPQPPTDTSPAPQPPTDTSPAPQPPTDTSPAPQPPTDASPAPQPPTDTSPAPQPPTDTSPAPQPPTDTSPAPQPPCVHVPPCVPRQSCDLLWYASPDGALVSFDGERSYVALPPGDRRIPTGAEGEHRTIEGRDYLVFVSKNGRITL